MLCCCRLSKRRPVPYRTIPVPYLYHTIPYAYLPVPFIPYPYHTVPYLTTPFDAMYSCFVCFCFVPFRSEEDLKVPDLSNDQLGYLNLTTHSANFLADPIDMKVRYTVPYSQGIVLFPVGMRVRRDGQGIDPRRHEAAI